MRDRLKLGQEGYLREIQELRPVSGCCVMIDVVGSTKLKDDLEDKEWIRLYLHTFDWIKSHVGIATQSKIVGDMMMFWFRSHGSIFESRASLVDRIISMQQWKIEGAPLPLKAAITECRSVYEITFDVSTKLDLPVKDSPPQSDVYGREIDLTSRLLDRSGEGEIIMNNWLYQNLVLCHRDQPDHFDWFREIDGPMSLQVKGFQDAVTVYKYRLPK